MVCINCNARITSADKNCPSCGLLTGIETLPLYRLGLALTIIGVIAAVGPTFVFFMLISGAMYIPLDWSSGINLLYTGIFVTITGVIVSIVGSIMFFTTLSRKRFRRG